MDWPYTVAVEIRKKMDRFEIHILEVGLIGHDYELKLEVRHRSVKFYSWFTTQKNRADRNVIY